MLWSIYIGVTDVVQPTTAAVNPIYIVVGIVGLLVVVIITIILVVWRVKNKSKQGM